MKKTLLTIIAGVGLTLVNAQDTLYVSASATGANDGSSWADANTSLQTALSNSTSGDEIWVAQGTYVPGSGASSEYVFPTFEIGMYGGFIGNEATRDGNRDVGLTILSGDANNDGIISVGDCYHILNVNTSHFNSVIDGFTFTGGNSIGSYPDNVGGAILVDYGDATIRNCNFIKNTGNYGGAIFSHSTNLKLINCLFSDNHAINGSGGAIDSESSGNNLEIINCTFYNNTASANGEVISNFSSTSIHITNSVIWGNGTTTTLLYNFNSSYIDNSIVQGGFVGATNIINSDPKFNSPSSGNFTLNPCSPAINAGDTTGISSYLNQYDLAYNQRFENTIDMGAYEYNLFNDITSNVNTVSTASAGDSLTYQWIDCSTNAPIANETSSSFAGTQSGSYACIVTTEASCIVDTSACFNLVYDGVSEAINNGISIYPNPTKGGLTVEALNGTFKNIVIYNILGEHVLETSDSAINIEKFTNGVYFVKITMNNNSVNSERIIKN